MRLKLRKESGQIVLITLLVLSIATTIVLSLIARTTTDVSITSQIEESSRAFSAAEAGIEAALKTGTGTGGAQVLTPGTTYNVTVVQIGGAAGVYQFPRKTLRGSVETLWLVDHTSDTAINETPTYTSPALDVCWGAETTPPALVTTLLYKSGGVYRIAKGAYDPDGGRRGTNNFATPTATSGGCGVATMYQRRINFTTDFGINPAVDTLIMLRLKPLYSDTQLAVDSGGTVLPLQGNRIESVGTVGGGITRKVVVYQQFRSPGSIFDAGIYSQGSFGH
ncbi:MAG: hypothetical protein ACOY0S_02820 [Patescibacteria group bacterium]